MRATAARLFLVLGTLLAVSCVGECVLRGAAALGLDARPGDEYRPRFVLSSNRVLITEMDPNDPNLNSDGLRDRDYTIKKPPGTVRIIALGDSVTYGFRIELDATYAKRLEALLNGETDGPRYEVINFGVDGYNTRQELERFRQKGRRYRPDLLLIGYTMNDVLDAEALLNILGGAPAGGEWSLRSMLSSSRFVSWVRQRATRVDLSESPRAYFVHLYSQRHNWRIVASSFAELAALAKNDGFDVLLVIFPYFDTMTPYRYSAIHGFVEREARKNGFNVLDLLGAFEAHALDEVRLSPSDPVHPSREGHAIAARAIHAHLTRP
ncbi:MAG: SGNH/GDSL hydrolase family protein [Deltaproteobacteria bacterium]|nr:SGNH/GDSL hydrolase family protein [Deltaproteobacteria bacterium]